MKKYFYIASLLALTVSVIAAVAYSRPLNISFAWGPSPSAGVASYNFYELTSTATNLLANTPLTNITITNVNLATSHTYAATSVDTNGFESGFSASLTIVAPQPPGSVFVIGVK